ncbi:helix-turn-helix transcriptional regulator [Burkholderia ubonensis]|nr:helix-turn-helix transcriptional regulator [Burkholderia ubonensis]
MRDRYVNVALGVREKRDEGAEDAAPNHRTGLRPDKGGLKMIELTTVKKRLLTDPATRAEYDAQAFGFAVARELVAARVRARLTQEEVAERMQTTHSTIACMESGRTLPSLRILFRYAEATGCRAVVRIEAAK